LLELFPSCREPNHNFLFLMFTTTPL
jgi:hypothetical protein